MSWRSWAPLFTHPFKALHWFEKSPDFLLCRHAFSIIQRGHCCSLLLWEDDMLKGWKHWLNSPGHRGRARVYRLFLPTGWRGLFHNVLLLSQYLELRERLPYLTHSCKSELNSSNSEKELQTRLLSIWTWGSSQGWSRVRDHLSPRFTGLITSKDCSKPCFPILSLTPTLQRAAGVGLDVGGVFLGGGGVGGRSD